MNKKIVTITIILIIAISAGVFYLVNDKQGQEGNSDSAISRVFRPFGINPTTEDPQGAGQGSPRGSTGGSSIDRFVSNSKFKKLTDFEVSGLVYTKESRIIVNEENTNIKPETELVPAIRYTRQIDGHIYGMYLDTGAVGKISNSTIPQIQEAIFPEKNSNNIIYRLLGPDNTTIKTILGVLGGSDSGFLVDNITTIAIAPNGNDFFYLSENSTGAMGTIGSFINTRKNQIFKSAFTEWIAQWPVENKIFLTTKASHSAPGYAYSISPRDGRMTKVMGDIRGLTTLVSPDGNRVLYSFTTAEGPMLAVHDIKNSSYRQLNIYGLPEKCVWSSDSIYAYCAIPDNTQVYNYPDAWYQGRVSFNDRFYRINADIISYSEIASSIYETPVDAVNLKINEQEDTIFFIDNKTGHLWSLDLK
jgi:hypothetical protein